MEKTQCHGPKDHNAVIEGNTSIQTQAAMHQEVKNLNPEKHQHKRLQKNVELGSKRFKTTIKGWINASTNCCATAR